MYIKPCWRRHRLFCRRRSRSPVERALHCAALLGVGMDAGVRPGIKPNYERKKNPTRNNQPVPASYALLPAKSLRLLLLGGSVVRVKWGWHVPFPSLCGRSTAGAARPRQRWGEQWGSGASWRGRGQSRGACRHTRDAWLGFSSFHTALVC